MRRINFSRAGRAGGVDKRRPTPLHRSLRRFGSVFGSRRGPVRPVRPLCIINRWNDESTNRGFTQKTNDYKSINQSINSSSTHKKNVGRVFVFLFGCLGVVLCLVLFATQTSPRVTKAGRANVSLPGLVLCFVLQILLSHFFTPLSHQFLRTHLSSPCHTSLLTIVCPTRRNPSLPILPKYPTHPRSNGTGR